jgi:hypothetical protein
MLSEEQNSRLKVMTEFGGKRTRRSKLNITVDDMD